VYIYISYRNYFKVTGSALINLWYLITALPPVMPKLRSEESLSANSLTIYNSQFTVISALVLY